MKHNLEIQEELQTIAPNLIGLNSNVFVAPNLYFNELPNLVLQTIKNQEFVSQLSAIKNDVPVNYFQDLPNQILAKIKQQERETLVELQQIAPTLNTISKQMPFSLPANYFENFKATTQLKEPAKIVAMHKSFAWAKYAAAACVVGLLAFVGYIFYGKNEIKQTHIAAINTNVPKSIEALPVQELEKGIEATKPFMVTTEVVNNANSIAALPTIEESLDFISTETLETYLNNNESEVIVTDGSLNN